LATNSLNDVLAAFIKGFLPPPVYTVSQWADNHRILSQKSSAEPGKWRTERTPYLRDIMDDLSDLSPIQTVVFKKASQIGAPLSLKTKIPTPTGWTTMGQIQKGDLVFDENGKQCTVTGKSEVFKSRDCYKISFSDGAEIVADGDHKWTTRQASRKYKASTLTTCEMLQRADALGKLDQFIDVTMPLTTAEVSLPVPPYSLGIFLGDGISHKVKVNKTFCAELKEIGVIQNKHIPKEYLRASYNQRLSLLQGLFIPDGHITNKGYCCFYSTEKKLADGVFELCISLGLHPRASVKPDVKKDIFIVGFSEDANSVYKSRRKITSIEKVESVPVQCISVDSDSHLFLVSKHMIPTHNSECGNNWVGYTIDHAPGPMLLVLPTLDMAKRTSRQRITPLIEDTGCLQLKVSTRKQKDADNTILMKDFPNGTLVLAGANSSAGLRSMPAKKLFLDEYDDYPLDIGSQGDPVKLAEARARTFGSKRKIFKVSTPTVSGRSRVEEDFENSDQKYFHVPCPKCDKKQVLVFKNLIWEKKNYKTVHYKCEHCGYKIKDYEKTKMLNGGVWVKHNPDFVGKISGYHLSGLYSPVGWMSWEEIAEEWDEIRSKKATDRMKVFVNTILGETWKEKSEVPDWNRLYERREQYPMGFVPDGAYFLTMGVDIQEDRIEAEVTGWGPDKESWSICYRVMMGNTSEEHVWLQLDALMGETFPRASNDRIRMPIKMTCVDSGFRTKTVYSWARKHPLTKISVIKGRDSMTTSVGLPKPVDVTVKGKNVRRGLKVWSVGVSLLKNELYSWLRHNMAKEEDRAPIGYCHFPEYDVEYFKQLTAEELVIKIVKGYKKPEWQKKRERNEALDCRVYSMAASIILGIDRYTEEHWRRLKSNQSVQAPQSPHKQSKINRPSINRRRSSWL